MIRTASRRAASVVKSARFLQTGSLRSSFAARRFATADHNDTMYNYDLHDSASSSSRIDANFHQGVADSINEPMLALAYDYQDFDDDDDDDDDDIHDSVQMTTANGTRPPPASASSPYPAPTSIQSQEGGGKNVPSRKSAGGGGGSGRYDAVAYIQVVDTKIFPYLFVSFEVYSNILTCALVVLFLDIIKQAPLPQVRNVRDLSTRRL